MLEFMRVFRETFMRRFWMFALSLALLPILVSAQSATPKSDAPIPRDQWAAKRISPPKPLHHVVADYPDDARIRKIEGMCLVSVTIDAGGVLENPRILHCTDPSFAKTSLDAAKQYRFKPAITHDGKPVAVTALLGVPYLRAGFPLVEDHLTGFPPERHWIKKRIGRAISKQVRSGFIPLEGGPSHPDSNGVYPLTREATPPKVIAFSDRGYGAMAFTREGNGACDILLTISVLGKASDPRVTHCERPELDGPAVASLLKSRYQPGIVDGKFVPMRGSMHLDYDEYPPK